MFNHSILYAKKLLTQPQLQNFYSSLAIYGTLILHIVKLTFWKVCHAYSTARATARQNRYQNLLWVSWQSSRVFSQAIERAAESLLFFRLLKYLYLHSTLNIKVKKRDMILNGNTLTPHINREVGLWKVQGRTSSVQRKVMRPSKHKIVLDFSSLTEANRY